MSDIVERPTDSNAYAWALFLSEWLRAESGRVEGVPYVAVQIAEALDAYWREFLAERTARMEANSREFVAAAELTAARARIAELEGVLVEIADFSTDADISNEECMREIARAILKGN
jgi:hypothetical protein